MRTLPYEIVHIDIMTSSVPGLILQVKGFLTSKKFHYTSFFVNDKSDFTYVYYQGSTLSNDTITAKKVYEAKLRKYGKEVRHYHIDNRTYATAKYKVEVEDSK